MAIDNVNKFYVIQFLELPYHGIARYVVVPHSWIIQRNSVECKAQVVYPREDPEMTRQRAEKQEPFDKSWKAFIGVIEYNTDDYDDAEIWIATMPMNESFDDGPLVMDIDDSSPPATSFTVESNNVSNGIRSLNANTTGNQSAPVTESRPNSHRQNSTLDLNKNKPQMKVEPLKNDRNASKKMSLKRSLATHSRTTAAMPASSTQSHQSSESAQRISVVSEDYLHHGYRKSVAERSVETNGSGQITHPQGTPTHTFAIDALLSLMDKRSRVPQLLQGCPSLLKNENQKRQELGRQETPNRSTGMDQISHRPYLQSISNNTSSALQKSTNSANSPCHLSERSQGKQNRSAQKEMAMQDSHPNKLVATSSTGVVFIDDSISSPHVNKKAPPAVKEPKVPDRVNDLLSDSHKKPAQSSYNVVVQQDSHVNKIIITRSNENECNHQMVPSQSTTKNVSLMDKMFLDANKPFNQTAGRSSNTRFPPASTGHPQHDPRTQGSIVRTTTGKNPMDLMDHLRNKAKSTPPAVDYLPNSGNRISQLCKPLNEFHVSKDKQSNVKQVSGTKRPLARESIASNQSLPTSAKRPREIAERSYPERLTPIIRGFLLQDPRSGVVYLKPVVDEDLIRPKPNTPDTTRNVRPAVQNIPTSANQSGQLHEKQCATNSGNYTFPPQPAQQTHVRGPVEMNGANQEAYIQNIPQNISSAAQNSSNSLTDSRCSGQCLNGREIPPVAQSHFCQDPRMQETLLRSSTKANYYRQSICTEINTDTQQSSVVNPPNIANQVKPTFGNSVDKQFLPVFLESSNQQPCPREKPVDRYHDQNCVRQSGCPQHNTENRPPVTQNSPSLTRHSVESSIQERHSPIDALLSDQEMPTENFIEQIGCPESVTKDIKNLPNAMGSQMNDRIQVEQRLLAQHELSISKIYSTLDDRYKTINNIIHKFIKFDENFNKVIDKMNDRHDAKIKKAQASSSNKLAKTKNKRNERREVRDCRYRNDYHDDNDDSDDDNHHEPPKKKRNQKSSFTFPPEYNPKNSRWTLKYRKSSIGVVEIMPGSRVYINAIRLAHSLRTARDCKTLARMLLTEIFSRSALKVCSLTGARAKAFDLDGTDVRPGLDEHARMILLTFVEEQGVKNGWVVFDTQSILNSIRSKIQEFRAKLD